MNDNPEWLSDYENHKKWHTEQVHFQETIDKELNDLYANSLMTVVITLLVVFFCLCLLISAYTLAQPWLNEIMASWEFTP